MPWPENQWRAIAADVMRRKGPVAGRAYLHKLKVEAGGHATVEGAAASAHRKHKRAHSRSR